MAMRGLTVPPFEHTRSCAFDEGEGRATRELYLECTEEALVAFHNEKGFQPRDLYAMCQVGESSKHAGSGKIGRKGIGFKSVFQVTDKPLVLSPPFQVRATLLLLLFLSSSHPPLTPLSPSSALATLPVLLRHALPRRLRLRRPVVGAHATRARAPLPSRPSPQARHGLGRGVGG